MWGNVSDSYQTLGNILISGNALGRIFGLKPLSWNTPPKVQKFYNRPAGGTFMTLVQSLIFRSNLWSTPPFKWHLPNLLICCECFPSEHLGEIIDLNCTSHDFVILLGEIQSIRPERCQRVDREKEAGPQLKKGGWWLETAHLTRTLATDHLWRPESDYRADDMDQCTPDRTASEASLTSVHLLRLSVATNMQSVWDYWLLKTDGV